MHPAVSSKSLRRRRHGAKLEIVWPTIPTNKMPPRLRTEIIPMKAHTGAPIHQSGPSTTTPACRPFTLQIPERTNLEHVRDFPPEYRYAYPFFISSCAWLRRQKSGLFAVSPSDATPLCSSLINPITIPYLPICPSHSPELLATALDSSAFFSAACCQRGQRERDTTSKDCADKIIFYGP